MFMQSDSFEADYYKGWLVLTDKSITKNYCIQLKDTATGRNITRKHFKDAVELVGFDKACNTFKKLSVEGNR